MLSFPRYRRVRSEIYETWVAIAWLDDFERREYRTSSNGLLRYWPNMARTETSRSITKELFSMDKSNDEYCLIRAFPIRCGDTRP
jgi:hypothetical protein